MKKRSLLIFYLSFIFYQEVLFHIFVFKNINYNFIYLVFYSIIYGTILYLLTSLFPKLVNKILSYFTIIFFVILFISQFIYNKVYSSIISIVSIVGDGTNQVLQFLNHIIDVSKNNWYVIAFLILPLIIFIILNIRKQIIYERIKLRDIGLLLLITISLNITVLLSVEINNKGIYSNKRLYKEVHTPLLTADRFGVLTMMKLDLKRTIFGFKEKEIVIKETIKEEIKEKTYNKLDIDWDTIINESNNDNFKKISTYLSTQSASNKNDYTGMFKDKNLIVFVAEALAPYAIDENLTPNLYRLYKEGFQFNNFYTPLFPVSTADGEYITDTSLIPKEGVWSIYDIRNNYVPYSYPNVFEKLGYTSQAYHNNTYTYYKRDQYLLNMGYDSYRACKNNLDINCRIWPQSDLEMIEKTTDDYINDDKFLAYYMTVSGHLEYTRLGNQMVTRNWSKVKDLDLSEKAKSYLACNIELDKAIGELIKRLEVAGKLNDTVIMISPDHYPYGLDISEIKELAKYEVDEDFNMHKTPFLIWNTEMKEPIKIDKYASSLDVLPTMLNLFGIEYDSRLLMGRDILSEEEGLVIFSNRSFLTEYGKYNTLTKKNTQFKDIPENYIEDISNKIYNKFTYSRLILESDYYRQLFDKPNLIKNENSN